MPPCTSLTIVQPMPKLTISEVGFARKNALGVWEYVGNVDCQGSPQLIGMDIGIKCKVEVTVNKANFILSAVYTNTLGEVTTNTYTFTDVDIGTYNYDLTTFDKYAAGTYFDLAVTAQNITPG